MFRNIYTNNCCSKFDWMYKIKKHCKICVASNSTDLKMIWLSGNLLKLTNPSVSRRFLRTDLYTVTVELKSAMNFSSKNTAFVTEAWSFELYWGYSQNYAHNEVYGFSVRASGHKNWKFMRDWIILIQILKSKYFLLWRNVYIHELATLVSETKTSYG